MSKKSEDLTKMIRQIELEVEDLNVEINNCGNIEYASDYMLKFQKYVMLIMLGLGSIFGGIVNSGNILFGILMGGLYSSLISVFPVLISVIFFGSIKKWCNNKIKNNREEIETYLSLRDIFEEDLQNLKENDIVIESTNDKDLDKNYNLYVEEVLPKLNNKTKKRILKK